jgi:hypothetical protein
VCSRVCSWWISPDNYAKIVILGILDHKVDYMLSSSTNDENYVRGILGPRRPAVFH